MSAVKLCGVESRVYELSAQDMLLSAANHPLVHFYENSANSNRFMETSVLKISLCKTLKEFPILFGRIQGSSNQLDRVVVDASNLNKPEFIESFSNIHYSEISKAGFNWNSWPNDVAIVGAATAPNIYGEIKLLSVSLVRLRNNSGVILFINIPHYVLDGYGYYEFINRWAELCRQTHGCGGTSSNCNDSSNRTEQSDGNMPGRVLEYVFDRNAIKPKCDQSSMHSSTPNRLTREIFTGASVMSAMLAMLPFSVRACIGSAGVALDYGQAHWFHVSKASIEELQRIVNDYSGSSDGSPLDSARSYALLATLADMCISRAERKHADSRSAFAKLLSAIGTTVTSYMGSDAAGARNHVLLNTVHVHEFLQPSIKDTRFIGNPLIMHPIATPLEQLKHKTEPKLYAQTVQYYESEMARIDLRMVSGFIDMVDRNPAAHANLATFALTAPSVLSVIDERRYGMHRVDFGCGAPSWVSGIPRHMPNLVAMFTQPADSSTGGVHLFVTLRPGVINHLLADSFFTTYAEFLY